MKKVMALDDQKSMQNILSFALKKSFEVTTVGTAADAIETAKQGGFDFLLFDIVLDNDDTDGIGVAQKLQEIGVNTPFAFLSSMTEETLEPDMKERVKTLKNIKFYQTKPITPAELVEKIKAVVGE